MHIAAVDRSDDMITPTQKQDLAATAARKRAWPWWRFVFSFFKNLARHIRGARLEEKLADPVSVERTEAQEAVDRVVRECNIPPDCVQAQVYNGGCAILIKHNAAWEMCIDHTYAAAAERAIEFLRKNDVEAGKVSVMNRAQRRAFEAKRRQRNKH
jgi:hypothetical protein